MTLLASWAAIDTHGTSSIYISADSRITWGTLCKYDYARKVYACRNHPDIFGYCGDVLFTSMVLSQIVEMADAGVLFPENATCCNKYAAILEQIKILFEDYPNLDANCNTFEIIHASREPNKKSSFECRLLTWTRKGGFSTKGIPMPTYSDVLFVRGIGEKEFKEKYEKYKKGETGRTSRSVFHCFCETLFCEGRSDLIGGAPQLVGLIRNPKENGIQYGMTLKGDRYFLGTLVDGRGNLQGVQWKNALFENCDGETGERKQNAQQQPNPHFRFF